MLLEKVIDSVEHRVCNAYGKSTYKEICIADVTRIFVFWIALKQGQIKSLFLSEDQDKNEDKIIAKNIDKTLFKLRFIPLNAILGFWDFLKWIAKKVTQTTNVEQADVLICVNHQKHKSYTNDIAKQLEANGKKVVYFHWPMAKEAKQDLPLTTSMPKFWTKTYLRARLCCSFIDYVQATLIAVKPKKVIVVEGDSYEHHIFGLLKDTFGYQCVCLQWGYEPRSALRIGYRKMPYNALLVWGDFFRNTFQEFNKDVLIKSVGHPKLDTTKSGTKGDALLFALQRPMEPYVTEEDIDDLIKLAINTAECFPHKRIIVRSHPNYEIPIRHFDALNDKTNITIHRYNECAINQSLSNAEFCISISSTLGFEAIYHGVNPLFIKCNRIPLLLQKDMSRFNDGKHLIEKHALIEFLESKESSGLRLPDSTLFFKQSKEAATSEIVQYLLN